jgi:hypothetical protein
MVEEAIHHVTTRKQSREREEAREPISVSRHSSHMTRFLTRLHILKVPPSPNIAMNWGPNL